MKTKLEKILEDLNAGKVAQAKKTLANLVAKQKPQKNAPQLPPN